MKLSELRWPSGTPQRATKLPLDASPSFLDRLLSERTSLTFRCRSSPPFPCRSSPPFPCRSSPPLRCRPLPPFRSRSLSGGHVVDVDEVVVRRRRSLVPARELRVVRPCSGRPCSGRPCLVVLVWSSLFWSSLLFRLSLRLLLSRLLSLLRRLSRLLSRGSRPLLSLRRGRCRGRRRAPVALATRVAGAVGPGRRRPGSSRPLRRRPPCRRPALRRIPPTGVTTSASSRVGRGIRCRLGRSMSWSLLVIVGSTALVGGRRRHRGRRPGGNPWGVGPWAGSRPVAVTGSQSVQPTVTRAVDHLGTEHDRRWRYHRATQPCRAAWPPDRSSSRDRRSDAAGRSRPPGRSGRSGRRAPPWRCRSRRSRRTAPPVRRA